MHCKATVLTEPPGVKVISQTATMAYPPSTAAVRHFTAADRMAARLAAR